MALWPVYFPVRHPAHHAGIQTVPRELAPVYSPVLSFGELSCIDDNCRSRVVASSSTQISGTLHEMFLVSLSAFIADSGQLPHETAPLSASRARNPVAMVHAEPMIVPYTNFSRSRIYCFCMPTSVRSVAFTHTFCRSGDCFLQSRQHSLGWVRS